MTALLRQRLALAGAAAVIFALRFLFRARVPDDYDSIGFMLAVERFDLAHLQPHFPGYPVYIALCKAAHLVVRDSLAAAALVSSLAQASGALAMHRLGGFRAVALYGAAWLPWLLGGAALSDSTAAALALAVFALCATHTAASGLCLALMLGVRLSYWPLALSWLALVAWKRREHLLPALAAFVAGTAVWLIPFVLTVGHKTLVKIGLVHLRGHFGEFGGSIATDHHLGTRIFSFARALFYDGLAPNLVALVAIAVLVVTAVVFTARTPGRQDQSFFWFRTPETPSWRRGVLAVSLVVAPYALWAFFAQNVVTQPRHVLPLVLMVIVGMAKGMRPWVVGVVCGVMVVAAAPLAWKRVTVEPAAVQAARYMAALSKEGGAALFGGRVARFVRLLAPGVEVRDRTWLSEADVELERMNVLPRSVWVTDEVERDETRMARLGETVTFCRDARIDRWHPCVTLQRYRIMAGR